MQRFSLRSLNIVPKLLLLTGVPLVALMIVVALLITARIHAQVAPVFHASSERLAESGAQQVAWWVHSHRNTLATLARVPALSSGNTDSIAAFMEDYGRFKDPGHEVVLFADADGEAFYHNARRANLSDLGHFREIVIEGTAEAVISDPVRSLGTGDPVSVVAHAVRDPDDRTVGLVLATVNIETLGAIVQQATPPTEGALGWIITAQGTVIAHSDPSRRLNLNALRADAQGYEGLGSVARRMVSGASGLESYTDDNGRPMTVAYHPIDGTPGWLLAVSMPAAAPMETSRALFALVAALLAAAVVAMAAVVTLSARRVSRPIVQTTAALNEIAEGDADLTRRLDVQGTDELARLADAFNRFVERIQDLVRQMAGASARLAAAAGELSATTEQSTRQIGRQQSETDQVATAMNEMTATVQDVARSAAEAARAAQETDQESRAGSEVVEHSARLIAALAEEVENAAGALQRVRSDSDDIGKVLDVIRGIAEQTNLLALNAAIEAARAGEQGRGFAVVADEVRTLASRTQDSTSEIQAMIERLQAGTGSAVEVMERSRSGAREGAEKAETAGASLRRIATGIATISDMNAQIASAAEEQSAVAEEVNRNVTNISDAVNTAASGSDQIASAAGDLSRLAEELQQRLGQYRI